MNNVTITGRLTADPELRVTGKGDHMVRFTVAVDRETAEKEADFIRCVAFRHSAEFLSKYCNKGDVVGVAGKIRTGSYDEKDSGRKVYTTDIYADRVEKLHAHKPKADYPNNGTAVYTDTIPGADLSGELNDDGDELPF